MSNHNKFRSLSVRRLSIAIPVLISVAAGAASAQAADAEAANPAVDLDTLALPEASTPLPAETRRARPAPGIEEIVVTAQRRAENLNDVPIAISAFSGEALAALGVSDAKDLANLVPGFTAASSGGNTPIYTLRGVGFNDTTYTATSTVGVYVDEVSLPYSVMTKGGTLDLERVEVLKGPQGILYGRNTTGGAINYIAKKPTEDFEAGLAVSLARFLTTEAEGHVSGNLFGDLNGRLAVKDTRSQQGWQYSNTRPDDRLGEKNKQAFRGTLEWQATEDLGFRLVGDGWWDRGDAQARQVIGLRQQNGVDPSGMAFLPPQAREYPVIPQDGDPRVADWPSSHPWTLNDRFLSGSLRADWQLGERTSFTGIASQLRVDSDGTQLPSSGFNYNAFEELLTAHIETSALELRFGGSLGADDQLTWLLGGNASKDRGFEQHEQIADYQSALMPDPVTGRSTLTNRPAIYGTSDVQQLAGFTNVGWRFSEGWTLTLGGRYTRQSQEYSGCSYVSENADYDRLSAAFTALSAINAAQYTLTTGQPGSPSVVTTGECFTVGADGSTAPFSDTLDESNLSLRGALDWKPDEDALYYASISRGFKAGGYPVLSASTKEQLKPVKQEEVLAFEIGSKLTLLEQQLHLNLAGYFYDYHDKQLLTKARDPFFGPLPVLQNAPKSRVFGAEMDLQYAPESLPGLFLALSAAYTHTEILEFSGLDSKGEPADFAGRPFNFAPRYQGTALVNYTRAVSDTLDLVLGTDYRYSGTTSSSLDADPAFRHAPYGLLGARLGMQGEQWNLTFFGRNLTNELVPITVLAYGDSISRFVGEPRTYGVSLRYDWR